MIRSSDMIHSSDGRASERDARALLQKLRDLNLCACAIEVSGAERVRLEGCASLDAPVELGVRYLLRRSSGRAELLGLSFEGSRLQLSRGPAEVAWMLSGEVRLDVELLADRFGRVAVPELGARTDLWCGAPRELEHFLRRLVRATFPRGS